MNAVALVAMSAIGALGDPPREIAAFLARYREHCNKTIAVYHRMKANWTHHKSDLEPTNGVWTTSFLAWDDRARFVHRFEGERGALQYFPIAEFMDREKVLEVRERDNGPPIVSVEAIAKDKAYSSGFYVVIMPIGGVFGYSFFGCGTDDFCGILEKCRDTLRLGDAKSHMLDATCHEIDKYGRSDYRILFDTKRTWVPREILLTHRGQRPNVWKLELEYSGVHDDVPLVRRARLYQHWGTTVLDPRKAPYLDYEVTEITPLAEPPDDKEFRPELVGAGSYATPLAEPSMPLWVWLLLAAFLLVGVAEAWRRIARRRRA